MQGEHRYYSVEEAANALDLSPARVREMLATGELEGLPPGATAGGDWRVLLIAGPNKDQTTEQPAPQDPPSAIPENSSEPTPYTPDVEEEQPAAAAGEDLSRGNNAAAIREISAPSGWVSTQQAAKALGISPRTVRWHIEQGNLEAKPEGEGVRRTWLVSIDSLQAFRDTRQVAGEQPRGDRATSQGADIAAESPGNAIRELADRLVEEAARASEFRVRLEISEKAQSTLEEELSEERRRREGAERERDELRRELQAAREARESSESPGPSSATRTPTDAGEGLQAAPERPFTEEEPERRPWWRRLVGGG